MGSDTDERQRRQQDRQKRVDEFLNNVHLTRDRLAAATINCLDEWARQVILAQDQPSANLGPAVIQLCKAVESELEAGLGSIPTLGLLRGRTLGQTARTLRGTELDESTKQRLKSRGTKVGFVQKDLAVLLGELAELRTDTGAAHGNAEILSARTKDEVRARQLAGQILKGIAPHGTGPE